MRLVAMDYYKINNGKVRGRPGSVVELVNTSALQAEDSRFKPARSHHRSLAELSLTNKTAIITKTAWGVSTRNQSRSDVHNVKGCSDDAWHGTVLLRQCRTMGARQKLTIATAARNRNLLVARMNQVAVWKGRLFARWRPVVATPNHFPSLPAETQLGHFLCPSDNLTRKGS